MTTRKRLSGLLADAALILYFVFALFPIAWMVILSLKPANELFSTYFSFTPTLGSYRTVLGDSEGIPFVRFFVNSLVVSVGAVALSLLVGLPAAYASARWRFKGSENLMFTLLSFRFAPELTVIIPLFVLYQRLGLFDTYVGMIWVLQLVTLPLIVWIMRSYFADLTPELEQAALLDGYTRKQAFFKVALPLVKPGVAAVSLLAFIFAWNNFVFPLILTSNEAQTVTVGALSFLGGDRPKYNLTAAAALVSVVPPLLLALTIQRYLVRGLSFGAVKS
ncbi:MULTISPECIES: carbohydrate ABC transporter permease [unclassified Streptomyces]|jgi:multiple sugar transport system permease protein|uniref:carbohydrate ABC transporter permease n=1 Tax=unclassified Streptomyces TaxID=2593676 RepID=UPI00115136BD|nr:carbohydrate ABC transporter permease [Streptomyces sp. SLBN-31]TQJ88169.1 carbohydrate ABC transporter membrane protein 2 (CUT1 family) [Streptomyces sp. SLBN-31]